jgi:SAM-dependent methyltransferase
MLAYYSVAAAEEFWSDHWSGHTVDELLAIARRSPLTTLLTRWLPTDGLVLEAGCGLGQYVLLLRERGWRAVGVDWSVPGLVAAQHRGAPLAAMQLRALALRSGAVAAYVSLGVVEHDPDGPDAILAEAARVVAPGGTLLVSVPYLNGARRLGAPWIARRQRRIAERGGGFYQYAFTRAELNAALGRHGFVPFAARPYDPARLLRGLRRRRRRGTPRAAVAAHDGGRGATPPAAVAAPDRGHGVRRVVRALLYTRPALALLGHMLLVAAVRR